MSAFVPTVNSHRNLATRSAISPVKLRGGQSCLPRSMRGAQDWTPRGPLQETFVGPLRLAAWLALAAAATAGCSEPSEQLASPDQAVIIDALRACRNETGDEVAEKVARVVARPDTRVATEAVRSLGRMRSRRAVRALAHIAGGASERRSTIRREAVVQLGRRREDPEAAAAIRQAVQTDPDPHVRAAAATGLGWRRSPAEVPLLVEVAESDTDPMVQACAVSAVERVVGLRFRYDPHASPDARRRVLAQVREMAMRTIGGPSKGPPVEQGSGGTIEP